MQLTKALELTTREGARKRLESEGIYGPWKENKSKRMSESARDRRIPYRLKSEPITHGQYIKFVKLLHLRIQQLAQKDPKTKRAVDYYYARKIPKKRRLPLTGLIKLSQALPIRRFTERKDYEYVNEYRHVRILEKLEKISDIKAISISRVAHEWGLGPKRKLMTKTTPKQEQQIEKDYQKGISSLDSAAKLKLPPYITSRRYRKYMQPNETPRKQVNLERMSIERGHQNLHQANTK